MARNDALVRFVYTNHRGETATRTVRPHSITFKATQYHPEPQWILVAWDIDKRTRRSFAMKDISQWEPVSACTCPAFAQTTDHLLGCPLYEEAR